VAGSSTQEVLVKRLATVLATLVVFGVGAASAVAAGAGGVTGPAIYVDGVLYRTVGTPTDFSATGAPLSSFETIFDLGGNQANVAVAAPGDPGFRGGRWQVHAIAYNSSYAATLVAHDANGSGTLDSAAEVEAALGDAGPGGATDQGVVKLFECPVIQVPHAR
jgi:hypothetical protein